MSWIGFLIDPVIQDRKQFKDHNFCANMLTKSWRK